MKASKACYMIEDEKHKRQTALRVNSEDIMLIRLPQGYDDSALSSNT